MISCTAALLKRVAAAPVTIDFGYTAAQHMYRKDNVIGGVGVRYVNQQFVPDPCYGFGNLFQRRDFR